MSGKKRTLGAAIFADIDSNEYLNKLYEKILYNYALHLLQLDQKKEPKEFSDKEMRDALRFADLLGQYVTNIDHMPENHQLYSEWDSGRFKRCDELQRRGI